MELKLICIVIVLALSGTTFGNPDLSQVLPNFQEKWFKYLRDSNRATLSEKCDRQVNAMATSFMKMENWAMQMFDATSKLQSGILKGNIVDFGDFNQCLDIRHVSKELGLVKGQHCMMFTEVDLLQLIAFIMESLGPQLPIGGSEVMDSYSTNLDQITQEMNELLTQQDNLKNMARSLDGLKPELRAGPTLNLGFGTCLPASCSPTEAAQVVDGFLRQFLNLSVSEMENQAAVCNTIDQAVLRPIDIACISVFSFIGILMILSTSYDVVKEFIIKDGSPPKDIFLAFSVWSNGKKVFAANAVDKSKGETLHCVHGLRALSIIWVMFCHRYTMAIMFPLRNSSVLLDWFAEHYSPLVSGGTVSVDTFFVLSGLLLSYIFLKTVTKTGNFNIPLFYIHRYLRLTPPLAAMILFQASLLYHVGSGPYWKISMDEQIGANCRKNWWPSFLYVQNYVNRQEICIGPTWYLACDMQLFILSPLLLVPLWKWAKVGVAFGVTLILAAISIVFAITYINEFGGAPYSWTGGDLMAFIYYPTHARFGPWVLGILLGYLLHVYRNTELKLHWLMVCCGWIAATGLFFYIIFGVYPFVQILEEQDLLAGAFFQAFSRIAWSMSICWIIFACTQGYGGPVNWFLSLPFWQPISRLSFCIYLTHYSIQMAMQFSMKEPENFTDFNMVFKFWGDFGITLTVSALWCLAFESPITVLEKVIFRRGNDKSKSALPEKEKEDSQLVSPANMSSSIENGASDTGLLESERVNYGYVEEVKS